MLPRFLLCAVASLWLVLPAYAQPEPEPLRWGKVPDAHLAMTSYPGDPEAHAVVLGDHGEARVERDGSIRFKRHRRVKILDEGGYDFADVSLTYNSEDNYQRVDKIQGQTFVLQPDGKVRRVTLDRGSIFTEDIGRDRKRVTFTLPALEPGAVVEFRYEVTTKSPLRMPDWYFQDEEPVLYSEFEMEHPTSLAYTIVTSGNPDFDEYSDQEKGLSFDGDVKRYRWVTTRVPALREERYMTTLDDYIQKLEIQLAEFYRPGIGAERVLKTWEQLTAELLDNVSFGRKLNASRTVRQEALAVTDGLTSPQEKAEAIYDYVRSTVVWDGAYRTFADRDLRDVLQSKRGTSAEINLLLVALLREAGLPAAPAILSTRGHGRILRAYPLVSQFNYTTAAVKRGGRWHLLDATDAVRPARLLPVRALNEQALVIAEAPEWVAVTPEGSTHEVAVEAALQADGALVGTLRSEADGYGAVDARGLLREQSTMDYVTGHLLGDVPGIEIGEARLLEPEDPDGPVVIEASFTVPEYAQRAGNLMLVRPLMTMRTDENPFKLERRTYPVDFAHPFQTRYSASISLPEGYAVDEVPRDALLLLPVRGGAYERTVTAEGDTLHISASMQVRQTVYGPNLYGDMKRFFDNAVAADAETVVLVQAPTASAPAELAEPTAEEAN